jgi:thiamine biosynthesis lipoprotein
MSRTADALDDELTVRSFRAIGTTATVLLQDPSSADEAVRILAADLDAIDRACSRFRPDSELEMVHAHSGGTVRVSALLFEALETACDVAVRTKGAVDPTVGNAIEALGYDRDLDDVLARPAAPPAALGAVAGFMHVQLNRPRRSVRIPRGVRLDLGSTAKALVADRAAAHIAHAVGNGVLVSIGGDVAAVGPGPEGGWAVGIALESGTPVEEVDLVVAIRQGGLASSAPRARSWQAGDRRVHHIVDPRTGDSAAPYWQLVSAVGASCVDANALTTAAVVWGADAFDHLRDVDQAMRLVRHDGLIFSLNGWPEDRVP